MSDNSPTDVYHYRMTVYTGTKRSAGTESNVFFMVSGEDSETEVRKLQDVTKKKVNGHLVFDNTTHW